MPYGYLGLKIFTSLAISIQDFQRHQKSGLMHKAEPNKSLRARHKLANKLITKKRYIIEECFGTMKRLFGMWPGRVILAPKN